MDLGRRLHWISPPFHHQESPEICTEISETKSSGAQTLMQILAEPPRTDASKLVKLAPLPGEGLYRFSRYVSPLPSFLPARRLPYRNQLPHQPGLMEV